jgi:hypothetical protein
MEKQMIRLTALWKNKSRTGKTYLRGNFLGTKVLILPNDRKDNSNQPDYYLCVAEKGSCDVKEEEEQLEDDL